MTGLLSFLGFGSNKIKDALRKGAVIVDVRTAHEFDQGRVPDSINIPVDRIGVSAPRFASMKRPIVLVSSGDVRSAQALQIMKGKGLKDVYNGGDWESVLKIIQRL